MTISQSAIFNPDTLRVVLRDSTDSGINVKGDNLVLDFKGAVIDGRKNPTSPDQFIGTGLTIEGKNITIRNLTIHGFKFALLAEDVDSLKLENCNFSYNYRQRLGSTREKEDLNDWLYYHHNESNEWKRYGAAIYLKNCDHALIRDVKVQQGQNGIMLTNCHNALIYNNNISFNSGIGIGLYRSSDNRIMHNNLNFNVRGYSHGIYQRGQDSAGILAYEQSSNNIFAFNSATHSGDGFFLWAGQHTMDSGEGGCNNNLIYENDFSYAPTNGIEVTFSANYLINNTMKECRYGIWGGYSFESLISGNKISDCQYGIAIEQGNKNIIEENHLENLETGIKLWARDKQPEGWGFAEKRDVSSRDYVIAKNVITDVDSAYDITETTSVVFSENIIDGTTEEKDMHVDRALPMDLPTPLQDGKNVINKDPELDGRKFIIVNEWGPYNFEYPFVWLRTMEKDKYIFVMFGPVGNWKISNAENFVDGSLKSGTFPNTLTATRINPEQSGSINFEFIGQSFVDQFGHRYKKGIPFHFSFQESQQSDI
ncbi:MAG: right-handed parallel beta-helix repeat-containing protein [Saprospiraceae bacterium]|nr:right-handed parallel beta-helix repeat-containing protein [Saprospiraceae bacterium]